MRSRFHFVLFFSLVIASLARAGETIDRIVAVVNGRPVMESEMVEALRLAQILANKPPQAVPGDELRAVLERLVDQLLLSQQMDSAHFQQTSQEEVQARIKELRAQVSPSSSDDAWRALLHTYDLSEADLAEQISEQLRTVRFIDARFRPSVRLEPGAVESYYQTQLVPKMKREGAQPVPMKDVEPKIREILVQQRMNDQLDVWLKALRAQAEIRMPSPSSALVKAEALANTHPAGVR
jgi:SurA-like protein